MFHLALASEWRAGWRDGRYTPARFAADGFVHCCDDEATTLQVAAAYFPPGAEEVLVADLDEAALDVEVRREAPAPPDGKPQPHHAPARLFPHVYGSIPAAAVTRIGPLQKAPDGTWRWPTEWAYGKPAP
ncbi:MAG: DUF952 domain-containing protein [Archangium sp.]|nr:DUF952 domain-containing protein [Archangium sp.]